MFINVICAPRFIFVRTCSMADERNLFPLFSAQTSQTINYHYLTHAARWIMRDLLIDRPQCFDRMRNINFREKINLVLRLYFSFLPLSLLCLLYLVEQCSSVLTFFLIDHMRDIERVAVS